MLVEIFLDEKYFRLYNLTDCTVENFKKNYSELYNSKTYF